jgi:LemA protein
MTIAIIVIVVALVLLALFFVSLYNRLVRQRNRAENAWAQVDVQLTRRHDLIPNLVETVKGYASHERETFDEVTRARVALQQAQTPAEASTANAQATAATGKLIAVAEAYPELKASQNFLELQEELTDTEDKIAAARRYYNATVLRFNTKVQSFPTLLVAGPAGFRVKELFELEDAAAAQPVQVSLQ